MIRIGLPGGRLDRELAAGVTADALLTVLTPERTIWSVFLRFLSL